MVVEIDARDVDGREDGREHDRRGALDVVIERAVVVAVASEQAVGVACPEVLPVDHRLREQPARRRHEAVDEVVVALAAHARVLHPDVELVVEQAQVVGADVEHDRDDPARMDAGCRRVDRCLADGDLDAPDALVTDAQDALGVGDDDEVDLVLPEAIVEQGLLDSLGVVDGEEDAAGAVVLVAETLDGLTDGRRVDDREHLLEMGGEQVVEEHLVAVTQLCQVKVFGQGGRPASELLVGPHRLVLQRRHAGRHQPLEAEHGSLGQGEGRAPVRRRIGQDGAATGLDAQR